MLAKQIREGVWEFKPSDGKVPVRVYATEKLFKQMEEGVFRQAENVSKLLGIQKASLVMPDGHYGYGFPIGGVAAFDLNEGVVSPGGVGYDINCGVRLLTTPLSYDDVKPKLNILVENLFKNVPSGVGSKSKLRISNSELDEVAREGAKWAVEQGYGKREDLKHIEESGAIAGANPEKVGRRAKERGWPQLGTLGSGNHFLEIQKVDKIFDKDIAKKFSVEREGQITVMVHCGSRGFGHQIADDYIKVMFSAAHKHGIPLPDRELACAPLHSKEAKDYISAMYCAVNYAFCNRQVITHWVRETFEKIFGSIEMNLVYDVCHNIAKFEKHKVNGEMKELCVHRKGATRAFSSGRKEIPEDYRDMGQPVIIPGDMGTASYLLIGTEKAMEETFGSTCFSGDTKVLTDKGILKLKEVCKRFNDEVFLVPSINPRTLEVEWKQVLNVMKRRAKTIEVVISQTGRSKLSKLRTTPDHKFITLEEGGLRHDSIANLVDNNKMVCLLDNLPTLLQMKVNPDLAYLVGALVSDGYIRCDTRHGQVTFTQKKVAKKLAFIKHVQDCFQKVFKTELREGKTKVGGGYIRGQLMEGIATDYRCAQKEPALKLLSITENLAAWALSLSEEATYSFIAGVIDGDGSWNPNHNVIDIFTGDEQVAEALVIACLKLGILPYVSKQRGNCFIIQISEKRKLIMEYTKRVKGIVNKRKYGTKLFSARQLFKNWDKTRWPFRHKAERNNLISDKIVREHVHKYPKLTKNVMKIITSPMRMQRVKKLNKGKIEDVFNLTVEENHNYVVLTDTLMPILVKNCHGAGRIMSRHGAIRRFRGEEVKRRLEGKGEVIRATSWKVLAEETPEAYKDIDEVIRSVSVSGISKPIARMVPLGVAKG
jgi:tRNA-splicing ligase RtcB